MADIILHRVATGLKLEVANEIKINKQSIIVFLSNGTQAVITTKKIA